MGRKRKWPPSIYPHKGKGLDRVRIEGHDHYLGPIGSEESKSAYARLIAELAAGHPPAGKAPPGITVREVVAAWWKHAEASISDRGKEKPNFARSLAPLVRLYGPTAAADFGANQLEVVQLATASGSWMTLEEVARAGKRGDKVGCSRKTTNRRVVRIRTVWRWAERKELVPKGSWGNLCALPGIPPNSPLARESPDVKPASAAELARVMRCAHRTIRDALRVQWYAGLRPEEVYTMRAEEIDCGGEVWVYRPAKHKNDWRGHLRQVALGPKARNVIRRRIEGELANAEGYLFPPQRRRVEAHYNDETFSRAVARAAERAGLKGWHSYQARHAAKERVTREMGLDYARSMLGQKSLSATDGYAAAVDLKAAIEAAKRLG